MTGEPLARTLAPWSAGAVAGGIAGVLFAVVMGPAEFIPMVGALYGLEESLVGGWIFHLLHSLVFGVVLVALARVVGGLGRLIEDSPLGALLGAGYGIVVWLIFASFVMPAWMGGVTGMSPPVPDWNALSFIGHIVYGATLSGLYPLLTKGEALSEIDLREASSSDRRREAVRS